MTKEYVNMRSTNWIYGKLVMASTACTLIVAGCAIGPDFHSPLTNIPATWTGIVTNQNDISGSLPSTPVDRPAVIGKWWTVFNDKTLDSLITRALKANLDLKQAESRIRQARAELGVVTSGFWPAAEASGEYRRSRNSQTMNSVNLYQAGLDASWELDIFGGTRRAVEAADAAVTASTDDYRDVLVTLMGEVALNYINLRGYQQQITIAKENLLAQEHSAELTRKLFLGEFKSKLDLVNAEAQTATTRSQIPVLEAQARQTIYTLSVLLADESSALINELSNNTPVPVIPPEVPVGLPSDLLRRRPDIRRAEAQLHEATARIGMAASDLFPKFSLTGSVGTSGSSSSSLVKWDNRFYSVGPTVTWAIFNAGKIRSAVKVQNELEQQSLFAYQKTVLTALSDVERALVAYIKEQQRRKALIDAVAKNQQAVTLSTQLYTEGQTDFLNVLISQRALYSAQDALAQSERTAATDLVAIYKALGGGWENKTL